MRHIFKKLHLGGGHDSIRPTNEVSPSPSAAPSPSSSSSAALSCGSDHRRHGDGAGQGPSPPSPGEGGGAAAAEREDYFLSEEEYQVQLALAISASNSELREDPDDDQIRAATLLSLGKDGIDPAGKEEDAAEALSRQYWDYNVLDYNVRVTDGFYDIFALSLDAVGQKMPSLTDLQTNIGDLGFEVIIVNRAIDPALVELEQIAQCIALDCPFAEIHLLVQRISDLVIEHMGGTVSDGIDMLARWTVQSSEMRTSLQTSLLPIGGIRIGLSRHRALLFKVLADHVNIPCKLVKGSHYTGGDHDAVNMIKLNNGEFLVDLMAAPGTLIPAEILNAKDASLNFSNTRMGRNQSQAANDSGLPLPPIEPPIGDYMSIGKSSIPEKSVAMGRMSRSEKAVATLFPSANDEDLPSSSGIGSSGEKLTPVVAERPHQFSPSTSTASHKQDFEVTLLNEGVKDKVNSQPQSRDIADSRSLFAELNPFQGTGAGKSSSLLKKFAEIKKNEPQRCRENIVSGPGRPPLPLVWKNRFAYNEFSSNKQRDLVEGSFPRKNMEVKELNASSSSACSSDSPESIYSEVPRHNFAGISGAAISDGKYAVGKEIYGFSEDAKESSRMQSSTASPSDGHVVDKELMRNQYSERQHQVKDHSEGSILQNTMAYGSDNGKILSDKHDKRKCTFDRFMDANATLKDPGSSSIPEQARTTNVDPMLDDVAECEILWEDLVIGERIGLGSYGEVYRADWNGKEVAVKKFLDQDFSGDALDEFRLEVRIMRRLRHPNVVLFMGAVTRPPNLSIVTEFLSRGSLYRILHRSNSHIDEKHRIKMALNVAMGMNCLHTSTPTIVHRDLKSPNLLVDMDWNVKVWKVVVGLDLQVCDFGLSRLKHNTFLSSKSTAGTPEWMAPEVLRNEPSNENVRQLPVVASWLPVVDGDNWCCRGQPLECDVYSFGVILWELATLRMPWSGMNPMQVVGAVGFQNRRLDIPKELDPLVARIIWQCWQTDPSLRPSFAQLTSALKPIQQLVVPSHEDTQSPSMPQETSVNSIPQNFLKL
ncbi:hypothetical protein Taro_026372 [Colocasia esculenta]|uniref:non-specific serine/threonine protein kinase n=1 Tax=Colocasia esculenta TaxID=4460 RepID=A0A843VCP7_COLES|nr:hypothetical protein [Colocasia esculenta]